MNSQSIERATSRNANNKHSTNGERNGLTKKLQLNLTDDIDGVDVVAVRDEGGSDEVGVVWCRSRCCGVGGWVCGVREWRRDEVMVTVVWSGDEDGGEMMVRR
ncbi:hypothetical protein Tco_0226921, partial [Tanacetum coccineum]